MEDIALLEIKTKYGMIRGVPMDGYTVFRGIRYGKPPVGDLRFTPPREPEHWEGVFSADQFGPVCPQAIHDPASFYGKEFHRMPEFEGEPGEDCLRLNIWTPAETEDEKLPVAIWIHGGAFLHGYSHEMEFDGAKYAKRGVILVTINYRLGALGFLAHPSLAAENDGRSGNYGILDQIQAISWVRENITGFGGDPEKITLFGQSAGCMSVQTLVSSALTKNWISRAIFQSAGGYGGINRDMTAKEAEKIGEKFVSLCGAESIAELRQMPFDRLLEAQKRMMEEGGGMLPFSPNIDGYVLEDGYRALADQGRVKDIPYMLGSTKHDIAVTPENLEKGEYGILYHACVNWSRKMEELGRKPSYVYYFSRKLPGDDAGAFHSSELWYMFGTLERSWRPSSSRDYALSREMLDYWTNFIKYGDPNGMETAKNWRPCTAEDPFVKILDADE